MSILGKFSDRQVAERRVSRSNVFLRTVLRNRFVQKLNVRSRSRDPAHSSDVPKYRGLGYPKVTYISQQYSPLSTILTTHTTSLAPYPVLPPVSLGNRFETRGVRSFGPLDYETIG